MIREMFSPEKYTTEELNARLKFFIGVILGLTLFGIVFVVLYSLIFVTQPMNGMSPVDNKFFELIIPIATFLTGTLSGIMLAGDDKELRAKAIDAASKSAPPPSSTPPMAPRPFTPTAPTFSAPAASPFAAAPVATGFGGKLAPPPAHEPEL
jgi:Na+-transporting methylmalonyl-CoA/oxaloacetate decarboxylase gamma subunit